MQRIETIDGNQAAAYASYALSEIASIYPITPSSPMAESVDEWSAQGKTNLFQSPVRVVEMQSEAGAAGAMHGSLQAGALAVTYTASQGLLLMIPNIYKMVGELLPGVLHVSARALATHALSIFGDHQDVMACRQTGAPMLASANVQEVLDLGFIAHLSAIRGRLPFIHFFDGFRTSHEYQKISVPAYEDIMGLVDMQAIDNFRRNALNPARPVARGTAQNPDIYFQGREVQNPFFDQIPRIVENMMQQYGKITGRYYRPFEYHGAPDSEYIVIAMGSVCDTIDEVVDHLTSKGEKVGSVRVHLYRPFSASHLMSVLPETVKRIAVLDRTKEPGASGEPLYLDVLKVLADAGKPVSVVGGRYGLGSKDTRPSQILSVFRNLQQSQPKNGFTIGIHDDVTNLSLPEMEISLKEEAVSCKFWGLGSDGTVGANKAAVKIIGNNTDKYVQAYFAYDSKKSGGTTVSHLRFGPKPIRSPYLVYEADYIACHNKSFLYNYDVLKGIKTGGIFVLNCDWNEAELEEKLPAQIKRTLAGQKIQFYIIDAIDIAGKLGLGNRINMVMQSAFFKLADIIPIDEASRLLKESNEMMYGKKGTKIVDMNNMAVDQGMAALKKVTIPESWSGAQDERIPQADEPDFIQRIQRPMARQEGDELPVSAFTGMEDGTYPLGTTSYEKRGIAVLLPQWQRDRCIQCGMCSYICPHATIRLIMLDEQDRHRAPAGFETKPATGKGLEGLHLRVQVSPLDCTGCGNCADVCPAKGKALIMEPAEQEIDAECENWEFAVSVPEKDTGQALNTIKGSQLKRPLLEFNGACPGCGETPYVKLLTQLFGDRMMIANATGCSSIWGASAPSIAYSTTESERGPAWANSLFEDNAEYGYGMYLGTHFVRKNLIEKAEKILKDPQIHENLRAVLREWLDTAEDGSQSLKTSMSLVRAIESEGLEKNPQLSELYKMKDFLAKRSIWIIGGDGWAYDIGYGGVDQVLSTGADVNLLVLDTEVYSNTGSQASKSTPMGAVAKFAASGKQNRKKDLGMMAMTYGNVYVAQVAMGSNPNQTLRAMIEAEQHKGPSLIIAYSPCVSHGILTGMGTSIMEEKKAVEAGYWHLYRYNPVLKAEGKNLFQLDSKEPKGSFHNFLKGELRYSQLFSMFPDRAESLLDEAQKISREKYELYRRLSEIK